MLCISHWEALIKCVDAKPTSDLLCDPTSESNLSAGVRTSGAPVTPYSALPGASSAGLCRPSQLL